ncbi:MAG: glycosyltransferase [Candidatus Baltobacteraceae bacterium]
MIEISVVIPTYNRLDSLRHVVPALLRSDVRPDRMEIVVADSNSNDGTAEYLREVAANAPHVRYLPGAYTGRAMARNAGIEAARAAVVLFTDADIIASPDLVSRHLAHHAGGDAIAIVGMEVQVDSLDAYERKRANPALREPMHGLKSKRLSWLYFMTGNASVRRADLDRVGRFDEEFTGYGHEDLELGYRLERAAVPIQYDPLAVNYHWHPVPYEEQKQKMELAGRSTVRFLRKHPKLGVRARLGINPLAFGWYGVARRSPRLMDRLDGIGALRPGLARTIVYQYHYLNGISSAQESTDA